MKTIKLIKIISGEELIGEELPTDPGYVTLGKVFQVVIIPQKDGSQQVGMLPFHIHTKLHDELAIQKQHIIFETEPGKEILQHYQQFTSPIIQPSSIITP